MYLTYQNYCIRNATIDDAPILTNWWNNGKIMAHAGFPNGINTSISEVIDKLRKDDDLIHRRLILEYNQIPIGEMNYRNLNNNIAEIGIKICDFTLQEKGHGRIFLSMLIQSLFNDYNYQKIILDTNLDNKRAQHVYELLGFQKVSIHIDAWKDQLGNFQSSIDYELTKENFNNFTQ